MGISHKLGWPDIWMVNGRSLIPRTGPGTSCIFFRTSTGACCRFGAGVGAEGKASAAAAMSFVTLDNPDIDEKQIASLVDQLGDDDPDKRIAAYQRLSQYGPKIDPILEKLAPGRRWKRKRESRNCCKARRWVEWLSTETSWRWWRGCVTAGWCSAPARRDDSARGAKSENRFAGLSGGSAGRAVQELPPAIVDRLCKPNGSVAAWGDEWIVGSPDAGPARFLPPNQLDPLLRQSERNFSRFVAIDSRGRWLLTDDAGKRTLILDPTVPDPTARLAIWLIDTGDSVGWNKSDWPAIQRGTAHWIINDHDWEPMDQNESLRKELSPPIVPATTATAEGPPLLVDGDGNRYYDGQSTIALVSPGGRRRVWPLGDQAAGSADRPAYLVADRQGHLFLFNSTGRIARLRLSLGDPQPFVLESVFTDHVPNFRDVERIWCDPAGRIVVAYQGSHLAMIFPTGQIPREIEDKILPQDLLRIDGR